MNIEGSKLNLEADRARDLWRLYRQHLGIMTPEDEAIAAIYKQIAQGKTVVRALQAITAAGLKADGEPHLAIARADCKRLQATFWANQVRYRPADYPLDRSHARSLRFTVAMPGAVSSWVDRRCDVPLIPIHMRPRKNLEKYHILFEADWREYPVDPLLLRRIGKGDAWLVVAAWDLTEVERAVMSHRLDA